MLRALSLLIAALACALMLLEVELRPSAVDAAPFHRAAAEAIGSIPMDFGEWEGTDVPVPEAAQTLLRPNALLSRRYRTRDGSRQASLVIVQCGDARDMGGHYPPICYPGQGWEKRREFERVPIRLGDLEIVPTRYEFRRSMFDHDVAIVIYDFFAVPSGGYPSDMQRIRALAADYVSRPFGAAQIQVVFDGVGDRAEEVATVQALLTPIKRVLELLADPSWRRQ